MSSSFKSNTLQVYSTDDSKNFIIDSTDNTQVKFSATHGKISIQPQTKLSVYGDTSAEVINDVYAYLQALSSAITNNATDDLAESLANQVARDSIVSAQAALDAAQQSAIDAIEATATNLNATVTSLVDSEASARVAADVAQNVTISANKSEFDAYEVSNDLAVAAEVSARSSAVSQEISDRTAAVGVVQADVDSNESAMPSRVDQLEVEC